MLPIKIKTAARVTFWDSPVNSPLLYVTAAFNAQWQDGVPTSTPLSIRQMLSALVCALRYSTIKTRLCNRYFLLTKLANILYLCPSQCTSPNDLSKETDFKIMPEFTVAHWVLLTQIILGASIFAALWSYISIPWGAPWVPSSLSTVRKMLSMAELQPGQVLVDLGAGDGRIVMTAARQFKAQAIGVEIDPLRCAIANGLIFLTSSRRKARVICGNLSSYDCSDADVVTLYLLQRTNQKLKEQLSQQLKPGAKIVSHTFSMEGWAPIAIDDDKGIFVYEIGNTEQDVRTKFV
jgi:hypothetical protein